MTPLKDRSAVSRLSPARRGHCLRCGGGFPSHIPSRGFRRHTDGLPRCAPERRCLSDLFRERAGCLQELKLLCKEQRRRTEAGRRPRGRPHRGAAAQASGHRAKWRWELRCGAAHPSGPGCARRSTRGSAVGPEHPSEGRQLRRRRQPQQ